MVLLALFMAAFVPVFVPAGALVGAPVDAPAGSVPGVDASWWHMVPGDASGTRGVPPAVAVGGQAPQSRTAAIGEGVVWVTGDVRSSEGVEGVSGHTRTQRVVPVLPRVPERDRADHGRRGRLPHADWSDLVQCRRQSGARLLHYATAPPAA